MSNQSNQENTEMSQSQKTEEQPGKHQPAIDTPVVGLKVEQLEERANPTKMVIC